nr:type VI secretion system-associated protein TagF [Dechloromonas sp.]
MSQVIASPATCFGKIPSRGDFVKGTGQHQLISVLDRWVSQMMERLSEDPNWKAVYDDAGAVDFAFVGARSRISVVGHLRPSTDSSGRRFPFITAATIEREDALMFRCAPVGLGFSFAALARIAEAGGGGVEVPVLLSDLEAINCAADFETAVQTDPLGNFVRRTTLEMLADILGCNGSGHLRRIILAIGILLRPVLGQGSVSIDKDLVLPLPGEERYRHPVAGLWLYLVSAFLRRTSVELQLLMERQSLSPKLVLGFNGAAPATLLAALSPHTCVDKVISLLDPEWIDDLPELSSDYGIAKLAAYLAQPATTLELAINTFREVFLGE